MKRPYVALRLPPPFACFNQQSQPGSLQRRLRLCKFCRTSSEFRRCLNEDTSAPKRQTHTHTPEQRVWHNSDVAGKEAEPSIRNKPPSTDSQCLRSEACRYIQLQPLQVFFFKLLFGRARQAGRFGSSTIASLHARSYITCRCLYVCVRVLGSKGRGEAMQMVRRKALVRR